MEGEGDENAEGNKSEKGLIGIVCDLSLSLSLSADDDGEGLE